VYYLYAVTFLDFGLYMLVYIIICRYIEYCDLYMLVYIISCRYPFKYKLYMLVYNVNTLCSFN
jgi:hypothetical protein